MIVSVIVAASENNVIGRDNQLPWNLPADLKYFKQTTMGKPIIMGRKTFESVGRPLPGRPNIVITRQADYSREGLIVTGSIQEALNAAKGFGIDEVFITGGSDIIAQALPSLVQRVYLTRVHTDVEGDAYFPVLPKEQWKLVCSKPHPADEKHAYAFTFEIWEKV